jgi:nucleoside-diphosphate-sugar epimerase
MKAFITGGAGFIGSNIVDLLLKNGHFVHVYDDLSSGNLDNIESYKSNQKFHFTLGDILDKQRLIESMKDSDCVFHLAASVGRQKSIDNPVNDSMVNLLGTVNVLESMRANKVKRIVYSSSAAIYGELEHEVIDENHPINPDCPYGVSKLAAEKMILAYANLYDINVHCLRYFNIYGVNQRYDYYGNVIPIFTHKILNNQPIMIYGDGYQTRDFVNVVDVARANYLASLSNEKVTVANIGSGHSITINQLAEMLYKKFDKKPNITYATKRIGDVLHCKANITRANKLLGFEPTLDIDQGLTEYVNWYKNKFSK